jgi:transposase
MRSYLTELERNFRIAAADPNLPTGARVEAIARMTNPSESYLYRLLRSGKGKKVRGKKPKPLPIKLRFAVTCKLDDLQRENQARRAEAKHQREEQ